MLSLTQLRVEIAALDRSLLSNFMTEFPDLPTRSESIGLNAFLVLAHGCVEEYVEEIFLEYSRQVARASYRIEGARRQAVAAYLWRPRQNNNEYRTLTLEEMLSRGATIAHAAIEKNHGIKEHNLANMAEAGGVEWAALERECAVQIANLQSFGAARGSVAHVSFSRTRLNSEVRYPKEVREMVDLSVVAIQTIDHHLLG